METYGCSLNISDTEYMEGRLREAGFIPEENPENADAIIINSCTVKTRTYLEFLKRLKFFEEMKRRKETAGAAFALVIAGCIPKANPLEPALGPYALAGTDSISEIAEVAKAALSGDIQKRIDPHVKKTRLNKPHPRRHPVIEIVPIAKGCLGLCSYCQTRLARGSLESYPSDEIVRQIHTSLDEGAREIWLTAQDTGAWGKDLGSSLPALLEEILKIPGDFRIRIGMANPNHMLLFLGPLLDLFSDERLYKFIHLPLQSGSDRILDLMNRKYTAREFMDICETIYCRDAYFSISTDVIVGFPGETEEDFERTLETLRHIRPAVVNRAKYSPRPHTPAAGMSQLPSRVVTERSQRLARLVENLSFENNKRFLGRICRVMIDDQKKEGSVVSRNEYYKPVVIPLGRGDNGNADGPGLGLLCDVTIVESKTYHLIGMPGSGGKTKNA